MRILHVYDHSLPLHSGYSFRSMALLKEQRAQGWETVQLTTPRHTKDGPNPEDVDGFDFYRTPRSTNLLSRLPLLSLAEEIGATRRRLEEVVEATQPDIIHAHSPVLNALGAMSVSKRHDMPLVYEIRGTWEDAAVANLTIKEGSARYRLTRALETYAARRVDALGVICEGLRKEFKSRGVAEERLFVVPNAVNIDEFTPLTERDTALEQELNLSGMDVVGFLGSFYDYEGLDCLVDAFALLAARRPNAMLLVVGGGPCESALKAQVERLGLSNRILLLGRVPHHDVSRYYSLVDILAYPRKRTRVTELVTPLKPLEAMAQCKLVIASDVGGHKELIRPGLTGELFAADDPLALATTIDRMLFARDTWPTYHANGLTFVQRERTWKHTVDNYEPVYDRLLRGKTQ